MPKYLGPAPALILGGKEYPAGGNAPASKELVAHLSLFGHRFEDVPVQEAEPTVSGAAGTLPDAAPDDTADEKK